jgi:antitoxin (DNA-binding transcriptional repressor) of toxin-antitoxin stability system
MQYISVHEAKTHLSRFIKKIEEGHQIVITNNGKPVAMLSAPPKPKKRVFGDLAHLAPLSAEQEKALIEPLPVELFDAEDEDEFYK